MTPVQKLKKQFRRLLNARKDIKIVARLGDLTGTIKADNNGNVWVTLLDGDEMMVRNDRVPHYVQWVQIGRDPEQPTVLQVLRSVNAFQTPLAPEVPDHNHTWGESTNPAWIRMEQILQGLAIPTTDLKVMVGGKNFRIGNEFHVVDTDEIDLSGSIPGSGAYWVNVEVDEDSVISFNAGSTVDGPELLTPEDIPLTASDKHFLFAVKMYEGQVQIDWTEIFDGRMSGLSSGGSHTHSDSASQEIVEDWVGAMVTGNTETGIAVTYDDSTGKLNFDAQTAGDARYLRIANNLSDLANAGTARTNLGLVAGGAGDIWVEKAGDTMTGQLAITPATDLVAVAITHPASTVTSAAVEFRDAPGSLTGSIGYAGNFAFSNISAEAVISTDIGAKVYIRKNLANLWGAVFQAFIADTTTGGRNVFGFYSESLVHSTTSQNQNAAIGAQILAGNNAGVTLTRAIGFNALLNNANASAVLGDAYLFQGNINSNTGQINTLTGLRIGNTANSNFVVGTVPTAIGIRINPIGASTSSFGIIIENITAGSVDQFAIYTNNGAVSFLGSRTKASAASMVWDAIEFRAATLTLTGTTNITLATGVNYHSIARPTITSAAAGLTITHAATQYIANAPLAAGTVLITNPYAFWVDDGKTRLDGALDLGATITIADGVNIVTNTTTGSKFPAATNQKAGFWGATPVIQQVLSAYTSDGEGAAYTGIDNAQAGTPYAQLTDLNQLRTAYETLRAAYDDTRTKLQTTGILG